MSTTFQDGDARAIFIKNLTQGIAEVFEITNETQIKIMIEKFSESSDEALLGYKSNLEQYWETNIDLSQEYLRKLQIIDHQINEVIERDKIVAPINL